eukprot:3195900-Pleurochrysis_carterae.AAC.1
MLKVASEVSRQESSPCSRGNPLSRSAYLLTRPCAEYSLAQGVGLARAVAGVQSAFTVNGKDALARVVDQAGVLAAQLVLKMVGPARVLYRLTSQPHGTLLVTYTAPVSG